VNVIFQNVFDYYFIVIFSQYHFEHLLFFLILLKFTQYLFYLYQHIIELLDILRPLRNIILNSNPQIFHRIFNQLNPQLLFNPIFLDQPLHFLQFLNILFKELLQILVFKFLLHRVILGFQILVIFIDLLQNVNNVAFINETIINIYLILLLISTIITIINTLFLLFKNINYP